MDTTVMGVDACQRGWIGIRVSGGSIDALFAPTISELTSQARALRSCGHSIDIPIGLPDVGLRQADVLGRRFVGPRSSSVFPTPVRTALADDDYKRAVLLNQELADGRGISQQAFQLALEDPRSGRMAAHRWNPGRRDTP